MAEGVFDPDYAESIVRAMPDPLLVVGRAGEVRASNRAARRLFGYTEEELSDRPLQDLLAEGETLGARLEKLILTGAIRDFEVAFRTKAGERLSLTVNGSVLKDGRGTTLGVILVGRDLRAMREMVKEIQKTERYAESIIANFLDSLVVTDPGGVIQRVNQATLDLLGYREDELVGKPVGLVLGDTLSRGIHVALDQGAIRNHETYYVAKNGRKITVSLSASVMKDDHDRVVGLVASAKDISETKRLIDDLRESHQELKATHADLIHAAKLATLGQLGAGIVHELNQPLNAIKLSAQDMLRDLAKGRYEYEQLPSDLRSVVSLVDRMAKTTDQLRVFSRKEAGGAFVPVSVNDAVEWGASLLREQCRQHDIDLLTELAADLPRVLADPTTLEQVFLNLIANARDSVRERMERNSQPRGFVRATSKIEDERVVVEVTDNGVGVAPGNLEKLFDAFFTTKKAGVGTGLGLYLARQIVRAAGGEITCDPGREVGATFRVVVPSIESVHSPRR